ncbi:MAG TPA: DUF2182 domain-containing protein [Vicinamibacterales bacterium]|nr:DUF2182 domain-containing protein [Vicinamibacterales bacterium]
MDAPPTVIERAIRRDRAIVWGSLLVVLLPCWLWIGAMAIDMYGRMDGASAWSMTFAWGWTETLLLLAMWIAMMTGMMLPSVAPILLLYARAVRSTASPRDAAVRVWTLGGGYLAVWTLFSAAATALQRLLAESGMLTVMMEPGSRRTAGVLLLAAGVYQLTPAKSRCLTACRSTLGLLAAYWRPGVTGALRIGVRHGLYCVGCCWALMLLLFAGGVMNLLVIAAITALVLLEKVSPVGPLIQRPVGALLAGVGLWQLGAA